MSNETRIIEIEGVKIEVDMRTAKRIDVLSVGTPVKVLIKKYGTSHEVYAGVVIGFEPFKKLPTVVVAYTEVSWNDCDVKFLYFNTETKDTEIVAATEGTSADRDRVQQAFKRKEAGLLEQLAGLREKRDYFEKNFSQFWAQVGSGSSDDSENADQQ